MKRKDAVKIAERMVNSSFKVSGEVDKSVVRQYLAYTRELPHSKALPLLKEYLRQMKRKIAEYTLEIETAVPLSVEDCSYVTKVFKSQHLVSNVQTKINPGLFGGMRLKVGDRVYDDSVSRKISQLKEAVI